MIFEDLGNIRIGKFKIFQDHSNVRAFFTTRFGGVSTAPFDSLNCGLHTGDAKDLVTENRRRLFSALGISENQLARQFQVHGDQAAYVREARLCGDTDALFTDRPDLYLAVTAADCVPILFFEPKKKIVGVIHAGWRGTENQIAYKTLEKVKKQFAIDGSEILAVLGPSISGDHYEVSEDVAQKFAPEFIMRNGRSKPHLDLWKANVAQLQQAGVKSVSVSNYCTASRSDLFFSHRGSGGRTGRMLGIIGWTDKPE